MRDELSDTISQIVPIIDSGALTPAQQNVLYTAMGYLVMFEESIDADGNFVVDSVNTN